MKILILYFYLALLPYPTLYMLFSIVYASFHVITQVKSSSITQNLIWDFLGLAAYWGYRYYYCMDHLVLLCMGREFNYQVLEPLGVGISAAVLEILGFY